MSNDFSQSGILGRSPILVGRFTYGFGNISINQWNEGAKLEIGSFCSVAANVTVFLGGNHRTDWITTFPFGHIYIDELGGENIVGHPATKGDVVIGNDVWIGSGVTILSGINIGDGAVLSANATVVKNVQPYEVVGGNPAKLLKLRFDEDIVNLLLKLRWWDLPLNIIKEINHHLCSAPKQCMLAELITKYRI